MAFHSNACVPLLAEISTLFVEPLMQNFMQRKPLRTGSLIVSILGDCVAPRGGVVWLGSLINVLAPLGISQRLVRTAVFRLVKEGILQNTQRGRRSYYSLTSMGRSQFEEATARIYAEPGSNWNGQWCLLLTHKLSSGQRQALRRDLRWLGFASLGSDLLLHPQPDQLRLATHLQRLRCESDVLTFDAHLPAHKPPDNLVEWVAEHWQLAPLAEAYGTFVHLFQPLQASLAELCDFGAEDAFYLRTFVIHEYRKILLRDPALPAELLPSDWPGHTAYQLTQSLYCQAVKSAEQFINERMENTEGPLPLPQGTFLQRFGGLPL